jgi:hypothetical protein
LAVGVLCFGGCAVINAPKSDKNYVFDSEKGRTIYSFSGENLYENSQNLGVYHMEGDGRVLQIDENKNIYDPKSNAKSIDSYMFDKNIGSVVKLEHKNGVCAAYSSGESIDFSVVTNQYNNNDWLGCGGKISQNDIFILKTSSKSMAQIIAKSKMKKMDNEIMVEDIALTSFCLNMGKSVKKLIDKNYCKF